MRLGGVGRRQLGCAVEGCNTHHLEGTYHIVQRWRSFLLLLLPLLLLRLLLRL